jgi:hypothetical protein
MSLRLIDALDEMVVTKPSVTFAWLEAATSKQWLDGEIGRRTGLKILWAVKARAGSIPAPAT